MISEQTFREELNGYLKRIGGEYKHKRNRNAEIEENLLLVSPENFDDELEFYRGRAICAEAERNQAANIPLESEEQKKFVAWFRENYRYPEYLLYAVPNGGDRDIRVAVGLKAEGVLPGVADLKIECNTGLDIYIEMKRIKGGIQSDAQKDFQMFQESRGKIYRLCYGFEDAKAQITELLE